VFGDHFYGEYQVYLKLQMLSVGHHHNHIIAGSRVCCVDGYISEIYFFPLLSGK
jgi:hypothetical protein